MRIVGRKPKENKITLRIENPEDLWHLDHLVEPGDVVISRTLRKVVIKSGDEVRHGERKPMVPLRKRQEKPRKGATIPWR
jgi:protein pelota